MSALRNYNNKECRAKKKKQGKRMCGILGIVQGKPFSIKETLLKRLKKLEYRGYDSVGFATLQGTVQKQVGEITSFVENLGTNKEDVLAIAHTRWATHGGITKENAHPHANSAQTLFVVHNGIIENYLEIKEELQQGGYVFVSQTDSEIIPHFIDSKLKQGTAMKDAIIALMNKIKGTFAILLFEKNTQVLYAMKRDSPLALGIVSTGPMVASDIYAFSDCTDKAIFFDDDEFAILTPNAYHFYNKDGQEIQKPIQQFVWTQTEEQKQEYSHYMLKEIHEQPLVAQRLLDSFATMQKEKLERFVALLQKYKKIVFIASGSSYHAALIGCILLNRLGYECRANIASEAETFVHFDKETLVIAISQSGETMDVISPLKHAKVIGATIVSLVNVPYSTIQRLSDLSLEVLAGQEICVAATKSYTNQVIALLKIAQCLGHNSMDVRKIPERIAETIAKTDKEIQKLAEQLKEKNDIFVLGRAISYPMAREIALKLKEISYIHAEGMMAGELKHGTIALIEKGTPVISLIPNNDVAMLSSTKEVDARGASVIAITNTEMQLSYTEFRVPECDTAEFAIYCCIIGHLLSYYIAKLKGCAIDKPRNLAKSVTVK